MMPNINPFPESKEKAYLRRAHLKSLAEHKKSIGRHLGYLGLPSAEMLDVKLWKPVIGHITAVERDKDVALSMYRTATRINVRDKMVIIERPLSEVTYLLALDDEVSAIAIPKLSLPLQEKIMTVRNIQHDVINLDLCGGFLYVTEQGDSDNVKILKDLIRFQAGHGASFFLLITFNLRDTGADEYKEFIHLAMSELKSRKINMASIEEFYLEDGIEGQSPQLRRLRFCVPAYLQKIALEYFEVINLGAWSYKTFYHVALFFEPRIGKSALGLIWPPLDEFKRILSAPLTRIYLNDEEDHVFEDLPAPPLTH